ncbi:ABC transporter ATP-binding protein [Serratia liquefaciens]|uniref:ABC transporter ATP-binding protein n=1 Tax=Serratia liquefaciens TaxID=614 RepID=UPI00035841A3|nr:ABC transporter ATP-binding protein [Serratia liquefaciens]AGQ30312.1 sugar ABC transporter ATP-binding protein [Serratia liquefaciens ATCC 27592]CAI0910413.1 Teichoic acids export ATP-binding protein TagH [Serratia liquefaciens]CAI2120259.1 Teichoic acids export ATP-binding protein TagH [Serratia liquefaciens]CAI2473607.1 Teichoic acids export ATP-binding protein TagH [Serratia liquefaciens]HEJ7997107.1 ABC transporter ATP-binding protein [Serratia liquefaciens]
MGQISVDSVGKAYKKYSSRFGRLIEWISPYNVVKHSKVWVLNDITFKVRPGEAVGIIGINGAGKSTLLKLITGTIQPTVGKIQLTGRVAALLELGMGFHPDFTGRQNVYMSGQLLGLNNSDIDRLMPEIEAFAEIGEYIDQPVRVYSSGMQMRLAFSVATAVRPDILIVDEALSVGDAYFQHKSFDRIRRFRSEGTTLLIVSHDKIAIQSICDRAILLNAGRIEKEGEPEAIMDYYNAMLAEKSGTTRTVKQELTESGQLQTISGSGDAKIKDIGLFSLDNKPVEIISVGDRVNLKITVKVESNIPELVLGYMIKDRLGQPIFGTNTYHLGKMLSDLNAGQEIEFYFKFDMNLGEGNYSIAVALHDRDTHINKNYEWRDLAFVFNVINVNKDTFVGVSWLPAEVDINER